MANVAKSSQQKNATHVFRWTVHDEDADMWMPLSPKMESYIDEQCLHFEENFVNLEGFQAKLDDFDQLNERFMKKLQDFDQNNFFESQSSTETVIMSKNTICKKCGHDVLRL